MRENKEFKATNAALNNTPGMYGLDTAALQHGSCMCFHHNQLFKHTVHHGMDRNNIRGRVQVCVGD